MTYKNLKHFIATLQSSNELIKVKEYVNPELEITEVTDRISKSNGKALLFQNTGTKFPVLINSMGSYKRMCMALGVNNLDEIGAKVEKMFNNLSSPKKTFFDKVKMLPMLKEISSLMPITTKGKAECQDIVMMPPDINKIPILKCWPYDGGKFITLPMVHTVDPVTGVRNVGMYRVQVFDSTTTAIHWHIHKVGNRHFDEYKKLGKRMPVAVAIGGDPVYSYVASAPLPDNFDEYILAGFIRNKKVEMVKCLTQDIEVPRDCDFVIEGYVDPEEDLILEGPFGDHTGYYSLPEYFPKFHITCITHRKDAVYPATIVGIPPMEDAFMGKATERIFIVPIKITMLNEILDMDMPIEGVFHNIAIVKLKKSYEGIANRAMNFLWGAGQMMLNKIMIIVDDDIDIHNYSDVMKIIFENTDFENDIIFNRGPLDILDHSSRFFAFGSKMGIDATRKSRNKKSVSFEKYEIIPSEIISKYNDIIDINLSLLEINIPVALISIDKNKRNHVLEINKLMNEEFSSSPIKVFLYFDKGVDLKNFSDVVWILSSNIDPERDVKIIKTLTSPTKICIDGTRKTKDFDNFDRDWPNIVLSDDETIRTIDDKWASLEIGEFITSPSLKYKKLIDNNSAIAVTNSVTTFFKIV